MPVNADFRVTDRGFDRHLSNYSLGSSMAVFPVEE